MPTEVILPRVDMDMAEGRISRWYVEEGATVAKGQPLFEMETDKAAMEIEAPASGTIRDISDKLDTPLPVGATVAWILGEGERLEPRGSAPPAMPTAPASRPEPASAEVTAYAAPSHDAESGQRATPLARRLAREQGLDLAAIAGSGPKGRVQAGDVEALAGSREGSANLSFPAERADGARGEGNPSSLERKLDSPPADRAAIRAGNDTGFVSLHRQWLRRGVGVPLVLIHGFGADLNSWRQFVATLRPDCGVLGIDLPGHGGSAGRQIAGFADMVDAVAGTLRAEGIANPHLAGHSLGGAVAAALAAREDIAARSLFLLAPAGLVPGINGEFLVGLLRARTASSLAPWLRLLVADPTALGPSFMEATAKQRAAPGAAEGLERVAATLFPDATQTFDIRGLFEALRVPTKIIVGSEDRIIPPGGARGLPGHIALHLFGGAGHMPHLEARDEVARLLAELMRSAA